MYRLRRSKGVWVATLCGVFATSPVSAGSHLWRFSEVFSNEDGSIQFVELHECCGSNIEILVGDKWVSSDATGLSYVFPENLVGLTANKYLLLGTAGYAAIPGAPTPDYIIPDNFFSLDGDTLRYWTYPDATMTWASGEVPTDGVMSLNGDGSTGTNSPTNFAGETGSVVIVPDIPTVSTWGLVVTLLIMCCVGTVVLSRLRGKAPAAVAV